MRAIPTIAMLWLFSYSGPPLETLGQLDRTVIGEASGIIASRKHPGIFWAHNDSGNPPLLFAIRRDGRILRTFRLAIPNIDWEDITIDDRGGLILGDIGNNPGVLPLRTIYRLDEPDPNAPADKPLKATSATFYAVPRSNRFDAEGLVYERGAAILVAKYRDGREAELFSVPLEPPAPLGRPAQPRSLGHLPKFTEPATGAALSADRATLAVCSSTVTRIYRRGQGDPPQWHLHAEIPYDAQAIEGIAWDGDDLILVAEGAGIYRLSATTWRAAHARREAKALPQAINKARPDPGAQARDP